VRSARRASRCPPPGANAAPDIFGEDAGNLNFNTGVADLPDKPANLTGEFIPPDDGFGTPGNGEFNTPSLIEAADTGPFFHNNAIETIEGAVAFYNGDTFNNSPAGQFLINAMGSDINLEATQVEQVAAFLRVINALENIRLGKEFLLSYAERDFLGNVRYQDLIGQARFEIEDAVTVLDERGLHPEAVKLLDEALEEIDPEKIKGISYKKKMELARSAVKTLERARSELIETP
jgi:hypothetical protein